MGKSRKDFKPHNADEHRSRRNNKPPPQASSERQRRAYELYTEELLTHRQIAAILKVSRSTVHDMIHREDERLAREFEQHILNVRIQHTAALRRIAAEASLAWERSKEDAVTIATKESDGEEETTTTKKGQAGDPRYLEAIRGALKDIRDIWGVDLAKPELHLHTQNNVSLDCTDEQLLRIAAADSAAGGEGTIAPAEGQNQPD